MTFFSDLWGFLAVRKKYWLLPIALLLAFFLIVALFGGGIGRFIYPIY